MCLEVAQGKPLAGSQVLDTTELKRDLDPSETTGPGVTCVKECGIVCHRAKCQIDYK